jgi:hypothetical protein
MAPARDCAPPPPVARRAAPSLPIARPRRWPSAPTYQVRAGDQPFGSQHGDDACRCFRLEDQQVLASSQPFSHATDAPLARAAPSGSAATALNAADARGYPVLERRRPARLLGWRRGLGPPQLVPRSGFCFFLPGRQPAGPQPAFRLGCRHCDHLMSMTFGFLSHILPWARTTDRPVPVPEGRRFGIALFPERGQ